jgi:hypothetical protein
MKLFEIANSITKQTKNFISKWVEGSTRAIALATPSVRSELKTTVTSNEYNVFRGWKFVEENDCNELFGSKLLQVGTEYTINLESWHSWTKEKKEAVKFSNPRFDSMEKRWFDDSDISELGYDYGDILGVGVLVEATIPASGVIADLSLLASITSYDEQEIITGKGQFKVKVLDIKKYFFEDIEDESEDESDEVDWTEHNKEAEAEHKKMEVAQSDISAALKKANFKETEKDIIRFLTSEQTDEFPIAAIMVYGKRFPGVIKFISKSAKGGWYRTYKHFNVTMVLQVYNSIT